MQANSVEELIKSHISCEHVEVNSEDQRHYFGVIVSSEFEGLMKIKRHRLVYAALGDSLQSEIHAFSFNTYTPEEYQALNQD